MRLFLSIVLLSSFFSLVAQSELTVEKIMRDPKWIGSFPNNILWSPDSKSVYFLWNPDKALNDSLFKATLQNPLPVKVEKGQRRLLPTGSYQLNKSRTKAVFEKYGDIYLVDVASNISTQITNTQIFEFAPAFSRDEKKIFFTSDQNLFSWELGTGKILQHTDFRKGKKSTPATLSEQEKWLRQDQLRLFDVLKERDAKQTLANKIRKSENPLRPKEIYLDEKNVDMIRISPDEKYITFRLTRQAKSKNTIVPNYVTLSGFTEDISGRTKVGAALNAQELFLYDIKGDTTYQIAVNELPGINDKVSFGKVTQENDSKAGKDKKTEPRQVNFTHVSWSEDAAQAVVVIRSTDNKDRWIGKLEPSTRKLSSLDRLHDDAWVYPAIGWSFSDSYAGWMNNNEIWYLSEESGYSHLYTLNVSTGNKKALTAGNFEVQSVELPASKKYFYLTTQGNSLANRKE